MKGIQFSFEDNQFVITSHIPSGSLEIFRLDGDDKRIKVAGIWITADRSKTILKHLISFLNNIHEYADEEEEEEKQEQTTESQNPISNDAIKDFIQMITKLHSKTK